MPRAEPSAWFVPRPAPRRRRRPGRSRGRGRPSEGPSAGTPHVVDLGLALGARSRLAVAVVAEVGAAHQADRAEHGRGGQAAATPPPARRATRAPRPKDDGAVRDQPRTTTGRPWIR